MSLLPTIRITEFLDKELTGGTTRPMLVIGEDGNKYVLKIFSLKDSEQRSYVVAEVMANILAKEFDLNVPDGVYMTLDKKLLDSIKRNQPNIYEKLDTKKSDGVMFGSFYHEGMPIFSSAVEDRTLDVEEFENIFAFDMLIANDDRRIGKPNILKGTEEYLLIDHEKAFEGVDRVYDLYESGVLPSYAQNHVFHEKLKKLGKIESITVDFETFSEYCRNLNLKEVEENVNFLIECNFDKEECTNWLEYLKKRLRNYTIFVDVLKKNLSE